MVAPAPAAAVTVVQGVVLLVAVLRTAVAVAQDALGVEKKEMIEEDEMKPPVLAVVALASSSSALVAVLAAAVALAVAGAGGVMAGIPIMLPL